MMVEHRNQEFLNYNKNSQNFTVQLYSYHMTQKQKFDFIIDMNSLV